MFAISFIVVALILGIGIGYLITPEYAKQSMLHSNNLGNANEKYDLRFIDAMIEHHEGAIKMAEDAKTKSNREEVLKLADEIIKAQTSEVNMMKEWKEKWYGIK
jgi:uncharacterized protein (DUF305 family)